MLKWDSLIDVLEDIRRTKGLSQAEAARSLGVTSSTLSRYEAKDPNMRRVPPHDVVERWAGIFGLEVRYSLVPKIHSGADPRVRGLQVMAELLASLDDEDGEAVVATLELIAAGVAAKAAKH